jgi:hypothetical protein
LALLGAGTGHGPLMQGAQHKPRPQVSMWWVPWLGLGVLDKVRQSPKLTS